MTAPWRIDSALGGGAWPSNDPCRLVSSSGGLFLGVASGRDPNRAGTAPLSCGSDAAEGIPARGKAGRGMPAVGTGDWGCGGPVNACARLLRCPGVLRTGTYCVTGGAERLTKAGNADPFSIVRGSAAGPAAASRLLATARFGRAARGSASGSVGPATRVGTAGAGDFPAALANVGRPRNILRLPQIRFLLSD